MKLLKLIITAILVWLNISLFAQNSSYQLSDYKLRAIKYNALDINFSLAQNNDEYYYNSVNSGDIKSGSFSNNLKLDYYGLSSSDRWFRISDINLNNNLRWIDQEYLTQNVISNSFNTQSSLSIDVQNSRYYEEDFFISMDADIYTRFQRSKSIEKFSGNETETKGKSTQFEGFIPLKIGQGRLEQVTDASQALFIIDALKKVGRLNTDFDSAGIHDLAKHISFLRNRRYFDFRLQRIYEMEQLDSFLLAGNYISDHDITYFATLNDMWAFGNLPVRYSGKTIALALYNGYYYDKNNSPFNFTNGLNKGFLIQGGIESRIDKPINQFWQNSFEMHFYLGVIKGNYSELSSTSEFDIDIPKFNIGIEESIGYYPNTRTKMDFSLGVNFVQFLDRTDEDHDIYGLKGHGFSVQSSVGMYYYLSPQLRLSGNMFTSYTLYNPGEEGVAFDIDQVNLENLIYYPACSSYVCNQVTNYRRSLRNSFDISLQYSFF